MTHGRSCSPDDPLACSLQGPAFFGHHEPIGDERQATGWEARVRGAPGRPRGMKAAARRCRKLGPRTDLVLLATGHESEKDRRPSSVGAARDNQQFFPPKVCTFMALLLLLSIDNSPSAQCRYSSYGKGLPAPLISKSRMV
jgi:hypothetical protein